jgi:hypothetical protein
MSEPKVKPIGVVDFKAEHYSDDRKTIIVSFATTLSAERQTYALPIQSLYGFIADLQKLQPPGRPAQGAAASPAQGTPAQGTPAQDTPAQGTPAQDRLAQAAPSASAVPGPPGSTPSTRIEVIMPQKWMSRALPERNVVLMVFDPQTEKQAAYALPAASIRDMAAALLKHADSLEKSAG